MSRHGVNTIHPATALNLNSLSKCLNDFVAAVKRSALIQLIRS